MISEQIFNLFNSAEGGVTTDTRNCGTGMIFFALKGENFDGNKFALQAIEKGCVAAVSDDPSNAGHSKILIVEDVLTALQELARDYRRTFDIPVLGLTGSNGKTTTKELVNAVLSKNFKTHATAGNFNNHIGVPLTLLSTPEDTDFLIVEMGANHQREIALLASIAEPTHGIITNIGRAHLEGFGGIEGVRKGKKELYDYLKENDGVAFASAKHPKVVESSEGMERVLFGLDECPPTAWFESNKQFKWKSDGFESESCKTHLEGDYNLENIEAAICIGEYFNVERSDIVKAIEEYVPSNNRSQVIETERNKVILDAYNANPSSMTKALKSFAENIKEDRLVILGDMRELGDYSVDSHKEIVDLCVKLDLEAVLVGEEFMKAKGEGMFYRSVEELLSASESVLAFNNKTVLLKGSRGMKMERLLPHL